MRRKVIGMGRIDVANEFKERGSLRDGSVDVRERGRVRYVG
jgi:hypothetical protein